MHGKLNRAVLAALALATLVIAGAALAQGGVLHAPNYPVKPVRMIVPLAPGGGSDIVGRIVALGLAEYWGQPVVVDNRPGAGSTVGTSIAARAPADGYTLMVSSSSMAISPALYKNLSFNIKRDFEKVTLIASQPSILAVHPSVPASSVRELIALARLEPGKLSFASAGPGSATHLGTELLQHAAGIRMLHVPYKSAGQATSALLSGEVQVLLTNMASTLPFVKSGRIRALGVSSLKRSPLARELPTIAEAGIAGFEYTTWYGMLVPAGTPKPVISRIQSDTVKVLGNTRVQARFAKLGLTAYGTSPERFAKYLNAEIAKWDKLVRLAGVRTQ